MKLAIALGATGAVWQGLQAVDRTDPADEVRWIPTDLHPGVDMRGIPVSLAVMCLFASATALPAQLPVMRLRTVFPPAGQVGTTFELQLTAGDDLEEVAALRFSHPGITAVPKVQEIEGRQVPVDKQFTVSIAAATPPGVYEVSAVGLWGASNPIRFAVAQRQQVTENDDNATPHTAQVLPVNTAVVGRMDGGSDVDCFRFTAAEGDRVVIDCLAERLDSRMQPELVLHDASGRRLAASRTFAGDDPTLVFEIPAAGDYVVELHDQTYRSGAEYVYRLDVHTGPQIAFVMPPAGPAGVKSRFTLWGYNLPGGVRTDAVSSIYAASSGGSVPLEKLDVEIDVPREDAVQPLQNVVRSYEADVDQFSWSLATPQGRSNPVRIGISDRASVAETEPNDDPSQAQSVTAPVEIAGQLSAAGDRDWIAVAGQPGDVYWIEVVGQRVGSTLDPVLIVEELTRDANGVEQVKRLTQQDDDPANVAQNVFDTFTDDPVYRLAVDREATYRVGVYDRYGQTRGDPALRYRLCIRGEEPDFRVVAVPAQKQNNTGTVAPLALRQGDSQAVDLYALRQRGYDGPIEVRVEGLPPGVTSRGTTIGSRETSGVVVFHAAEDAVAGAADVRLIASAACEDPGARRAVDDAAKRVTETEKPIADLRTKRHEARDKLQTAVQQRDEAARRSSDDPGNSGFTQELAQRQQAVASAQQQYTSAADALAAAEQTLAAALVTLDKADAALTVATQRRQHVVRVGTLTSGGQNNVAARGRLAQSLTLAVLREPAPFEVRAELPPPQVVAQSQQILAPVQLIKRNGFDDKVQLTPAGMPKNANLQVPNVTIEKGKSDGIVSIFVKETTPPGTYAVWINAQGQVSYSRNPERTARIVAEREQSAERLKAVQAAATAATEARATASKRAEGAQQGLQAAQPGQQQAEQAVAQREKEVAAARMTREAAEAKVAAANQLLATAEAALQGAQEKLAADAENADLQGAVTQAEAALSTARTAATEATAARDAAAKALVDVEKQQSDAAAQLRKAIEAVAAAQELRHQADAAKAAAEAAEKTAQEAVKAAEERKQADDKRVEEAEKVSKPQNKNFTPTCGPVVFEVVPAPVKLSVTAPNGGAVQRGKSLEVGVKVERLNRFVGPVRLGVWSPPQVTGLTGEVLVPAEATEAKLIVNVAADAAEGQPAHMVLRASVEHQGRALSVDVPLVIKISP